MSNKATHSVDWLVSQYEQKFGKAISKVMEEEIQRAKTMHKFDIEIAFLDGKIIEKMEERDCKEILNSVEYYNETFGGEND